MSGKTGIQWTDETWNPVVGCDYVSEGCRYCYAANFHNTRMYLPWKRGKFPNAPAQYHQPFWGPKGGPQLIVSRLTDPLHWRKPRRVFVNSVSDLFHEAVPDEYIAQVFAVMSIASGHTFQVLTKRPGRMQRLVRDDEFVYLVNKYVDAIGRKHGWVCVCETDEWPLRNVWLGVSVENQQAADERVPLLLETPAAVRFLSCEPLLGPIDLHEYLWEPAGPAWAGYNLAEPGLDWVIVGGESGVRARVMEWAWMDGLHGQCIKAGVPFFLKQFGSVWAKTFGWHDRHGGDPDEWLEEWRVREFPTAREAVRA